MVRLIHGLAQPVTWVGNAPVAETTASSHVRPLVGTHRIDGDSARAFILQHERLPATAGTVLTQNLAQVPDGRRPIAPSCVRLRQVGVRCAESRMLRGAHEEETTEVALEEARALCEAASTTTSLEQHRRMRHCAR